VPRRSHQYIGRWRYGRLAIPISALAGTQQGLREARETGLLPPLLYHTPLPTLSEERARL
jgi:hypothetical protein